MSVVVLDASALIALLQGEAGAKVVGDAAQGAAMSAVNFGEVAQRQYRDGKTRVQMEQIARELGLDVVPVDGALALDSAELREICRAKGLSQADCICLALAKRLSAPVLTGDRKWPEFADTFDVEIRLIR